MKGRSKDDKVDIKSSPLSLPCVAPLEHAQQCPKYTAVVTRNNEISIEDVEGLQTDLEVILLTAAQRIRNLHQELEVLQQWQEGAPPPKPAGKGSKLVKIKEEPTSPPSSDAQKRSASKALGLQDETPNKKFKPPNKEEPKKATKFKYDAPNRFWALVEPYCAEITQDDLKVLEVIMNGSEGDMDYFKVPALGKSYVDKWAKEDLKEECKQSAVGGTPLNNDPFHISEDESSFGPLTQRLVQALVEENIMTCGDISEVDAASAASITPQHLARQLHMGSAAALERRIKKELEDHGLLEPEHCNGEEADEVLTELRRKQAELKTISSQNAHVARKLFKLAKEEMHRQQIKQKLALVDAEVVEAYQRIKAKSVKSSKKDVENCKKLMKERQQLIKQLEAM